MKNILTDLPFLNSLKEKLPQIKIYLVGGSVRNYLLDRPIKDYDLVISQIPIDELKNALEEYGKVKTIENHFPVLKFIPNFRKEFALSKVERAKYTKICLDIALPRKETSLTSGSRKSFEVISDPYLPIEEDLSRRDFTINAIAYDIFDNKIIDPFDGQTDLKSRTIKTVGNPDERLNEDYSRILRAVRFSTELSTENNEFEIEPETQAAIKKIAPKLHDLIEKGRRALPYETISEEFFKSIMANPAQTLLLYKDLDILKNLFPEIAQLENIEQKGGFHEEGNVLNHILLGLKEMNPEDDLIIRLAVIFHDLGKFNTHQIDENQRSHFPDHHKIGVIEFEKISHKFHMAKKIRENVSFLIKNHMLLLSAKGQMKATKIYHYFCENNILGNQLLRLSEVDIKSSLGPQQKEAFENFSNDKENIFNTCQFFRHQKIDEKLPIDGQEIMTLFNLEPSKKVGELLALEKDFIINQTSENKIKPSKEEIISFLKNHL